MNAWECSSILAVDGDMEKLKPLTRMGLKGSINPIFDITDCCARPAEYLVTVQGS